MVGQWSGRGWDRMRPVERMCRGTGHGRCSLWGTWAVSIPSLLLRDKDSSISIVDRRRQIPQLRRHPQSGVLSVHSPVGKRGRKDGREDKRRREQWS